ncbi:MAG: glycosyl transferase family 2 [Cyanobacteria bacterium P01_H01_bin.35]
MEKAQINPIIGENMPLFLSSILILGGAIIIIPYGDFQEPATVIKFWIAISIMSLGFIISWTIKSINYAWFWSITILARLILIPMEPGNDIWRYLWEGYIQNLGFSPYNLAPNAVELIPYRTEWWSLINHPDTSAIYPPLSQLGFRVLAAINPSVLIFKLAFILADLGICWLLSRKFSLEKILIYAWNPLIIYSFAGGAHYDSWFILPLVAAWLAFDNYRWYWSSFLIGISVAIKWMSLPILCFIVWQKILDINEPNSDNISQINELNGTIISANREQELRLGFTKLTWNILHHKIKQVGLILLIGLLPMCIAAMNFCEPGKCSLIPTSSNFVVKGRSAEFIPYLVSLIWEESTKYNWIYGIPLGLGVGILIWNSHRFVNFAESYFFLLLILSPIVHAWYFTWFIPFAVATRNLGIKWVSLSTFIYFILTYRQSLGDNSWLLSPMERYWLWFPLIIGFIWSYLKYKKNLESSKIHSEII